MASWNEPQSGRTRYIRLNTIFLCAASGILLAMVGLAYREWSQYSAARAAGLHLLDIENSIETLVSDLRDAESGQRAFLLSGERRYLEPYNRAVPAVPAELARLNRLITQPGAPARSEPARLNELVDQELRELRESIQNRTTSRAPVPEFVLADQSRRVAIQSLAFAIRRQAALELGAIQTQALWATRGALFVTIGGSVFLMFLLAVGYRAVQQGTLARERAAADMRNLHDLGVRLMQKNDLQSLLREVLQAARGITGADRGTLQILGDDGTLRIEAQYGFSVEFLDFFNTLEENQEACGTASARRERLIVDDVERSPIFMGTPALGVLLAAGARAVQATPMISRKGVLVGMLSTHHSQPRRLSERDLSLIDLLARQAADLIEKIRDEEALRRSEERYRATFDNAAVGIAHVGLDGAWLRFNDALCTITGYSREELHTKTFGDITHPDDLEADLALAHRVRVGEIPTYSMEKRYLRKDGSIVWVILTVSLLRDSEGEPQHYISVIEDINDRKLAEDELRAAEHRLLSITDNMAAAVTRCSRDFRYVWVSRGYAEWLRQAPDQIVGRHIRDIIGAQGYENILPYMERVLTGERVEYSTKVRFIGPGERWIHAVYVPTYFEGQVDGWIAVVADITDTVEAQEQLRDANADLSRANQDLKHFAFAASHDLQEPLRMITAYSQMLSSRFPQQMDREASWFVANIVEGTERMRELLSDLLTYMEVGPRREENAELVDLKRVVENVKQDLRPSLEETGTLISADELPCVRAHAAHLTSLFQNLIANAIKYRANDPPVIHISAELADGQWRVAVADNGIGIAPQYHKQIFEVFKRLHGRQIPGTGVGLAICKRVVERYGGRLWVESSEGQGATFYFTLPEAAMVLGAKQ